ncbi:MAG: LacI family DNA-binding transcriptional regulator [Armatimonadota bacterium]|nr:LacI family transcriptional regulator [bacterium]
MQNHTVKITSRDVANKAGVSRTTVSYVLTGGVYSDKIPEETRQRVIDAARRLGYAGNSSATALRRGYSDNIVILVVTWDLASTYSQLAIQISERAGARGLPAIVHVAQDDKQALQYIDELASVHPYGLIMMWDSQTVPADQITHGICPMVDLFPSHSGSIAVTSNREQGVCILARYLLEFGHRRIGMMLDTKTRWRSTRYKLAGYVRALESYGIDFDESLLEECTSYGFEAGYEAAKVLINRHPNMTAMIGINDEMALGAMVSAQDMGLKVPGDVSVAGYGGSPDCERYRPTLTSVSTDAKSIAGEAIDMLIQMRSNPGEAVKSKLFDMKLVARNSTGPARQSSLNI